MKDFTTEKDVQELRRKFAEMDRASREQAILDIIKGIHSASGAILSASKNDSYMAVFSANMDIMINSPLLPDLMQVLCDCNNAAVLMKADIEDAKMIDGAVPDLTRNIRNSFNFIQQAFNKVFLFKYLKPAVSGNVVPFKKKEQ